VTGSDLKRSPVTDRLEAQGIRIAVGHNPEHVGQADAVTYSPAVAPTNVELVEARRLKLACWARPAVLGAIAATRRCIAVAGTNGKTTTASMLSLILVEAGFRPSFLVGADVNELGSNAVWDTGEWLVLEADESYGTFATLRPEIGILTNVEADHLDHYGTFEGLQGAFTDFLVASTSTCITTSDEPVAAALGARLGAVSVGVDEEATYRMESIVEAKSAIAFDLVGPDGSLGRIELPMPGLYNGRNAAVAAVGALDAGAPFAAVQSALARFAGVPRRFEFRGEAGGVTFVDDYAHLPGEVRAMLGATRAGGWGRVVAVFQPHRYTRTASLASSFAGVFDDADVVVITDVFGAGERPVPGVSGKLVADAVAAGSPELPVRYAPTREDLRTVLGAELRSGDLCCTLGAGDLTTLADDLLSNVTW
jgi:UDP-N-acetylmuramate--alanine ligase